MKDLLPDDRPREKLRHHGPSALGDNELVALVLGSGSRRGDALSVANALLAAHGGLHGLARCTATISSGSRASAVRGRRRSSPRSSWAGGAWRTAPGERFQMRTPREAAAYLMPRFGSRAVEQFGIVLLDTKHRVVRTAVLAVGGQNSSDRAAARGVSRGGHRRRGGDRGVSQLIPPAIPPQARTMWS